MVALAQPAGSAQLRKTPAAAGHAAAATASPLLLRRAHANRDQRGVGRGRRGTAGCASFAQELRWVAGRATIGRHQDFVVLALDRAPRYAVRFDDPNAGAGRTGRALRPGRTGWTGRTSRTRGPDVAFRALRPCWTRTALRALAATGQGSGQARQQRYRNCQMRCTHFRILPSFRLESRSRTRQQKIKLGRLAQGRCPRASRTIACPYWRLPAALAKVRLRRNIDE